MTKQQKDETISSVALQLRLKFDINPPRLSTMRTPALNIPPRFFPFLVSVDAGVKSYGLSAGIKPCTVCIHAAILKTGGFFVSGENMTEIENAIEANHQLAIDEVQRSGVIGMLLHEFNTAHIEGV